MKVLALVTDGFGAGGGIARYNRDLMTALAQSNGVNGVVVLPRNGDPNGRSMPGLSQLAPAHGRLRWSIAALRLAASRSFDVMFCGHLNAAPLAAFLARATAKPLWLQVHGIEAWQRPHPLIRRAAESAHLITSVSRYTRTRLLAWADIDPARVRVLPNTFAPGFAGDDRKAVAGKPAHLLARHDLSARRIILTVARMSAAERYKGHDRIIAALPAVLARHPDASYVIVGSGDDRPRIEQAAHAAGVAARVVFAGEVAADELPDYFRLADVFAMPSTGEGFGIVFLEAAVCGLPVVAGNRDGSIDALADGRLGRLVDPDDAGQLVSALCDALDGDIRPEPGAIDRFAPANFSRHVDDLVRHHI